MKQRVTSLGTPCSGRWPEEWVGRVEEAEGRLGRRVCGAATWDGGPCTMAAEHGSGRCRYHGGHAGTGAPLGSENARVHGLYQRRLQRCGPHCPLWDSCAFSGEDVLALPGKQRPVCAYEREEYAALVQHYFKDELGPEEDEFDEDEDENEDEDDDKYGSSRRYSPSFKMECPEPFLMHQLIMLTIMTTRAAAVLSHGALTDAVQIESPNYRMKSAKPGAALEAFIRIVREYRGLRSVIDTKKLIPPPRVMGIGSRMRDLMKKTEGAAEEAIRLTEERRRKEREQELKRSEEASKLGGEKESRESDLPREIARNAENDGPGSAEWQARDRGG